MCSPSSRKRTRKNQLVLQDTTSLTNSATYGKCNVIYVGIPVTTAQKATLQEYSRTFRVRIVYFNAAETANDPEVNSRLGISQDFTEPLVSAPFISLARKLFVFRLFQIYQVSPASSAFMSMRACLKEQQEAAYRTV